MTEAEIVDDMLKRMSPVDKHICGHTSKDRLIGFHHGVGTSIRNYYRLWDDNNPYTDNSDPMGDFFADQVSQRIIEGIWEKLNGGAVTT